MDAYLKSSKPLATTSKGKGKEKAKPQNPLRHNPYAHRIFKEDKGKRVSKEDKILGPLIAANNAARASSSAKSAQTTTSSTNSSSSACRLSTRTTPSNHSLPAPAPPAPQPSSLTAPQHSASVSRQNRALLGSLKSASNPITHSTAYARGDHVTSCATGHQVAAGAKRDAVKYWKSRNAKLKDQRPAAMSNLFVGVTFYINGYAGEEHSNLELLRLISLHGGAVSYTPSSRVTHTLTTRLSGSKTHAALECASARRHIVRPEWVVDCIKQGKRLSEEPYDALGVQNQAQPGIKSFLVPAPSASSLHS